jgi:hypothetical protein
MSQAVANAKQFAGTTKGIDVRSVLPTPSRPPLKLRQSAMDLREQKKLHKAGKGELDVEATKEKREKVAAQKFGRYFDDPNLRSRQFSDEAMTEAEGVVKDFKKGPYADDAYDADDAPSEPIKVKSERIF